MSENIKPCPFCGGEAELDTQINYRNIQSGEIERAISAYCRECIAEIKVCVPDVPDITAEQVIAAWNQRDQSAIEAARQEERLQAIADFGQLQTALEENTDLHRQLEESKAEHSQLMAKHNALHMNAHELRRQLAEAHALVAARQLMELRMYEKVLGMRDSTETYGEFSSEAVRMALHGVLVAMDELEYGNTVVLDAILAAKERETIERCAKICELALSSEGTTPADCLYAIRAMLKNETSCTQN